MPKDHFLSDSNIVIFRFLNVIIRYVHLLHMLTFLILKTDDMIRYWYNSSDIDIGCTY